MNTCLFFAVVSVVFTLSGCPHTSKISACSQTPGVFVAKQLICGVFCSMQHFALYVKLSFVLLLVELGFCLDAQCRDFPLSCHMSIFDGALNVYNWLEVFLSFSRVAHKEKVKLSNAAFKLSSLQKNQILTPSAFPKDIYI